MLLFQILFQSGILLSILWQLLVIEDIPKTEGPKSSEGAYANCKVEKKKKLLLQNVKDAILSTYYSHRKSTVCCLSSWRHLNHL